MSDQNEFARGYDAGRQAGRHPSLQTLRSFIAEALGKPTPTKQEPLGDDFDRGYALGYAEIACYTWAPRSAR